MDVGALLAKVAPWIGAAVSGNVPVLVGMAAKTIGDALGHDISPTVEAITQAVAGATPDQMLALKQADNDFAVKMQQLGFEHTQALEQIAATDRANARQREIITQDKMPAILALLVVSITAIMEGGMLFGFEPRVAPELVGRILGTMDTATILVLTYYFGTTSRSARKTELIAQKGS